MTLFRKILCAATVFFLQNAPALFAQTPSAIGRQSSAVSPLDEPVFQEILENIAKRNLTNPDFDAHQLVEHLENLADNPLDLNTASRTDLENLWLLTEAQVAAFFEYREKLGPFLATEEMQAIPGWDLADIKILRPFFSVENGLDTWAGSRKSLIINGKDEFRLRTSFRTDNQNLDEKNFAAPPVGHLLRYRHTNGSRVSYGFAADTDPGEHFFSKENRQGFDFYSAHFFIKNWSKNIKAAALGDFKINFGQGLVLASGFSIGKNSSTVLLKKSDPPIRPHASGGEDFFQRGAAFVFSKKNWESTVFGSHRRRDAAFLEKTDTLDSFDEVPFGQFAEGGMHRLPSEILNEKKVRETLFGATVHREIGRFRVGLNTLTAHFDHPISTLRSGSFFEKSNDKTLIFNSLDYSGGWRNILFFGETARSETGGMATINGTLVAIDRRVTMAFAQRFYGPNYQPLYGAAFGEIREPSNERGFYSGMEFRPRPRLKFNGFLDIWTHPRPRAESKGPSSGREWLVSGIYSIRKKGQVQAIFRHETHEKLNELGPFFEKKWRLRIQSDWKITRFFEWRARAETTHFKDEFGQKTSGFLTFQELRYKPLGQFFTGALRFTAFESDGSAVRLYSFESQLLDSYLIPSFSGKGSRVGFRGDFQLDRRTSIGVFLAKTSYLFPKNRRVWDVRAQVRMVF